MKLLRRMILGAGMVALLAQPLSGRADAGTNAAPDFKDVYDLLRSHLVGEGEADLNRDAVQGLLMQLHGKVSLVAGKNATSAGSNEKSPVKSLIFEGPIGYLRIGKVTQGLAGKIATAYNELNTNQLEGLVLDLRFAEGDDYAEAAAVADLFIAKERPLLDWGKGIVQSKEKTNALTLNVVVLINQKTSGAAEALAAVLREDDRAILLGGNTSGDAAISEEFPLKNGDHLRIATAAIKLGEGETLSTKGVAPDIRVNVKPDDEQAYLTDPYKQIQSAASLVSGSTNDAGTNRVRPHQISEVDLMRARKEKPGVDLDALPASSLESHFHETEVERPIVHDPVLGRALDLIKGIAVMNRPAQPVKSR